MAFRKHIRNVLLHSMLRMLFFYDRPSRYASLMLVGSMVMSRFL